MPDKQVFVVCPIGAEGSPERNRSDELMKYVITPISGDLGYTVVRADQIGEPGRITAQIARELGSSELVIADLTGLNPNVMYELGVRQGLELPYVQMAQRGQNLPFDLADVRTIFYELTLGGVESAKSELRAQMDAANRGEGSIVNRALFSAPKESGGTPSDKDLMVGVLESNARILREVEELRNEIQGSTANKSEVSSSDFSSEMMTQMLKMGMEDPGRLEQFMKVIQGFQGAQAKPQARLPLVDEQPKVERAGTARQRKSSSGGTGNK